MLLNYRFSLLSISGHIDCYPSVSVNISNLHPLFIPIQCNEAIMQQKSLYVTLVNTAHYYMASSESGQDDLNRVMWLATRAGKMEPSCPLGTTRCIPEVKLPRKPFNKSLLTKFDQVCSVKIAGYWPRSFFASLWTETKYPAILTSHLVNNPYIWPTFPKIHGSSPLEFLAYKYD